MQFKIENLIFIQEFEIEEDRVLAINQFHPIVQKLKEVRDYGTPDTSHRTLLLLGGGWGAGAISSGVVWALREARLLKLFNSIVGVSSGGGVAAYAQTGDECAMAGATVFWDECCSRRFLRFWRKPIADIDYIEWVFRESSKRLDVSAVLASEQQLRVTVSSVTTGRPILVNPKTVKPDLISAIKAAVAVPGLYDRSVTVNGRDVADGIGDPLPVECIKEVFNPSEVLIVANCTQATWERWSMPAAERVFWVLKGTHFSREYKRSVTSRYEKFHESRRGLGSFPGEVGVLFSPYDVPGYTQDSSLLHRAANDMILHTLACFGEEKIPFRYL